MTRMKESGIDWIGKIPEEWEVSKLEQYVDIYGRIGFRGYTTNDIVNEGEGAISYSPSNIIDYSVIDNNNTYISWSKYDESPEIQIKTGDVLYVKTGSSYGKTGIVNKLSNKATINPQLVVLKPKKNTDSRLINYFLNSSVGKDQSELIVGGSTIPTITQESIKKMIFPKMSFEEQQKIADFLDKKTAQLDKVKALLEEQIQKLKDYRASLIYEVVTKGLDKTVPMKDSGIDWIGQVPEGWGVKPIKHVVATPVTDGPHETPLLCETGIPFLSAEAVKNGVLDFNYKRGFISLQDHERFKKKISPKKDDIFIVKSGATTGNVGIVNTDEIFDIWSPLALIRCKKSLAVQKYIYYYLISNIFKAQVEFNWSFGTQQNIGMGIIENIKLILPPLSEQTKISDLLDKKTYQIDQLIQIKNKQIENINKQRQTFIYDYVTGKRRV
ncbi:MAG: restriction endonuclease subunit S [Streptococcus parasanguinis]|nr:restriction endonuclease subunit S [Streptococcus parasanguinis]MDU1991512.1 restriction endonuclease subunit S [Streptococcus parasanguinis]